MNNLQNSNLIRFALVLALAAGLAASTVSGHAQGATATIFGVPDGANYDYTITLQNTGSSSLNGFWYGWTGSGNNLPSNPTSAGNLLGWANILDNNSIRWQNSTGTALLPGHSGTFTFVSTSIPAAITTPPSGGSVAYNGTIDFSQGLPGDSSPAFSPVLVPAPEPSSLALLAAGLLVMAGSGRWLAVARKSRPVA